MQVFFFFFSEDVIAVLSHNFCVLHLDRNFGDVAHPWLMPVASRWQLTDKHSCDVELDAEWEQCAEQKVLDVHRKVAQMETCCSVQPMLLRSPERESPYPSLLGKSVCCAGVQLTLSNLNGHFAYHGSLSHS